jgi:hypothetical protein
VGSPRLTVSVVGAGQATAQESAWAEEVGRLLAERGAVLVCGGLGGVMEAACSGARAAGGLTVGILPGYDRTAANPWTDVAIATGLAEARNVIVAASGDGVIAVGGSLGTLSEIAFALKLRRPVVTLGSWHLDPKHLPAQATLFAAQTPAEAVDLLFRHIRT